MSRLIVISNRVSGQRNPAAQGGLSVALAAALREYRGLWFGWSGNQTEHFTGHIDLQRHDGVTTATIDLEEQDVDEYYNGYANRTLWPLFHYRIDLAEYDRSFGSGYERVNERFAETVTPLIEPDDLVWVHDYHLIPLGSQLRERGITNRIGFFLHIPWPPSRLLVSLPFHKRLVRSLLAYDLIGFQTEEWLDSFRHYIERELGGHVDPDGTVHVDGRTVKAAAFPIGIDYKEFQEAAGSEVAREACLRLRKSAGGKHVVIGVDRLDYSKGLEERFAGYRRFLEEHGDRRGDIFLLQIAPPSRGEVHTYEAIREHLDELSGRINGDFADVDWVPIRYVNQGYPREELAGFYRASEIALITPLRDGMNLVAKEYIAAQDPDNPGVLILSRFAGAALQLEDALLVNPYSKDEISDALHRALEMPRDERIRRWEAMIRSVREDDVVKWRHQFVAELEGCAATSKGPNI
ncbi:alpha,alpha-trehalose-phosphate synthase (UDP-forming) [Sphingosinicella rhizophila]|uniref:Trehalose-6-phosphate synthase n=1 Tax=Sphingosinicella rhizophila TaxID=3050082 RepID=A0ABU3Q383_9SPHN|nr:alpha,alpha-trehalose-phosphate synthase (UDP-forming) [Sphingosinicella sp. GR2756]MDT9597433.1 alpha,alpha-trehalose-phosphate synthase (UDP-forming) [Sphingosinicella sp. GR2756]